MALKDDDDSRPSTVAVIPDVQDENPRSQACYVRPEHEGTAMSWSRRLRTRMLNFVLRNRVSDEEEDTASDIEAHRHTAACKKVQYRLEAARRRPPHYFWRHSVLTCCGILNCRYFRRQGSSLDAGPNPNQKFAGYLHWMFRVNFVLLFTMMCVAFFGWTVFFAGWITLAGRMNPQCVRIGGLPFSSAGTPFSDAFALSWTTFSTVGYGSTSPALGHQNSDPTNCVFINFICALEALVGVLYSGFCGAILFGKVLRIQSRAQVVFSDPIVVRYGSGVIVDQIDDGSDCSKIPCPVLEFRIANRLFNESGGEIMDATLNVVASIDTDEADHALGESFMDPEGGDAESDGDPNTDPELSASVTSKLRLRPQMRKKLDLWRSIATSKGSMTVDEEPVSRIVSKHNFSKMLIEASEHPFFKRVWLARHVLNENSPILVPRVRRQIRRNGGYWPGRLSTHDGVRESLRFNQILVSLNGVSNVSASDVYSQKIYDFVDVNVGYQFVNILYKDRDGAVGVDTDLINDVREQNGGGGEPLIVDDEVD